MALAVDSTCTFMESTGVGLPPEKKPGSRIFTIMGHEEWGHATIYDMDPAPEPVPPAKSPEKVKTIRKSMLPQPKLSKVPETAIEAKPPSTSMSAISGDDIAFWCLPFFQSSMMATILEDTATELRILSECNNSLRITKAIADINLLLGSKYGVKEQVKKDELDGIDPKILGCMDYKLNKLIADRKTVFHTLLHLYVELSIDKGFVTLLDFITAVQDREEYAIHVEEEEARNRMLRKELAKQLRIQRNHHKTVAYDAEALIDNLKSQVEDASLMSETEGRYVDNWQAARIEQHKQIIFEAENIFSVSSEYYKQRSDHESRVHAELESLNNILINENLKAIEDWMDKYETDMEKIDLRIQIQKHDYQNMNDKRREMEKLYAKRAKELQAWILFKEVREKERLYETTMQQSAIAVQAWWRGLLVRKQLGPFKPKKKKGGKK